MNEKPQYQQVDNNFLDGFSRVRRGRPSRLMNEAQRQAQAVYEARVTSAAEFVADLLTGSIRGYYLREALSPSTPEMARIIEANYPGLLRRANLAEAAAMGLQESMTVSDFPLLMGDVLDRMMLARFAEVPQVWRQYIGVGQPLRDFRTTRLLQTDGGNGLWNEITDSEGLQYTNLTESGHTIAAALYGKAVRLSWRMLVNDDLDAFAEVPAILGQGGRNTVSHYATSLLFDANGPDATFISAGNGNLLTGNPDLAIDSLATAIATLHGFQDSSGMPILVQGVRLVHGPGLTVVVNNLMNQLSVDMTNAPGVSGSVVTVNNWLVRGLTAVEDPFIKVVCTSNAATSWLLTADPNAGRPAARIRFLQGFEQPNLYQKAGNTARVSGGIDDALGDFQSMANEYKGLVAFGGATIEPKSVVGSNGSNA